MERKVAILLMVIPAMTKLRQPVRRFPVRRNSRPTSTRSTSGSLEIARCFAGVTMQRKAGSNAAFDRRNGFAILRGFLMLSQRLSREISPIDPGNFPECKELPVNPKESITGNKGRPVWKPQDARCALL